MLKFSNPDSAPVQAGNVMQQSEDYSTYYMNPPGSSKEPSGQYSDAHNKSAR